MKAEVIGREYDGTRVPSTRARGENAGVHNLDELPLAFFFFSFSFFGLSLCNSDGKTNERYERDKREKRTTTQAGFGYTG